MLSQGRVFQQVTRAIQAYRKNDWDTLAEIVLPLLPALPDDRTGHSDTPERRTFERVLRDMRGTMPLPIYTATGRYLHDATDGQLRTIANHVESLAVALENARELHVTDYGRRDSDGGPTTEPNTVIGRA